MKGKYPPPARNISSTSVDVPGALRILETYIANSLRHPHLHPDSQITLDGIRFPATGGSEGGSALHHMRRIAAGYRGETLEHEDSPEPSEDGDEDAAAAGAHAKNGKKPHKKRESESDAYNSALDDDWQDKEEYELEQGVDEVGEIAPRTTFVQEGGPPEVLVTGGPQESSAKRRKPDAQSGITDKEARKRAKKEKNKQQRQEKEKKRQEGA